MSATLNLEKEIFAKLNDYVVPYVDKSLGELKAIKEIDIKNNIPTIKIVLGFPLTGLHANLIVQLEQRLSPLKVQIILTAKIDSHVGQKGLVGHPKIKNMIAIGSGKGGVGKSTVATNLALALIKEGARVGLLDADIYGPSQPLMLGAHNPPEIAAGKAQKKLFPVQRYGLQTMSIGYLVHEGMPMIWRGPMVSTALQQLLNDTEWEPLDYLIIDLPPGTGDIQLTMAQKIPVSAAVIVTTPQDLALLDAARAYEMFQKVNIPVLGLIENMSLLTCSHCGHQEAIFGYGGGETYAHSAGISFLGRLPLNKIVREKTDAGEPLVQANPDSEIALLFREMALKIAAKLSLQIKDYSSKFGPIIIK